jgi:molybdate transport system substrate-binding protein
MKRFIAAVVLMLVACSGHGTDRTLTVLAAASLRDPFQAIAVSFERAHPGTTVRLEFGASNTLAGQIEDGAAADVFASAGSPEIERLARSVGITDRVLFARNRLVVIVPRADPANIKSFADLARGGVKVVLAAPSVPAGRYARAMLAKARIERPVLRNVVSNEPDVKGVVQKVMSGEADAGIAYETDLTPAVASKLSPREIPARFNESVGYPIAIVHGSPNTLLARAFVQAVTGTGRHILQSFGFLPP